MTAVGSKGAPCTISAAVVLRLLREKPGGREFSPRDKPRPPNRAHPDRTLGDDAAKFSPAQQAVRQPNDRDGWERNGDKLMASQLPQLAYCNQRDRRDIDSR
jgi:hypothetical protein